MNVEQIEHLISNSNIRDLIKVPNKDKNLIKSLVKLTQEKKWCYQYGCTTCGALGLGANITFFAMQKSNKDFDFSFIIEKKLDWLILCRMSDEIKDELVKVLCHELNQLKDEEISEFNQEVLRFIILEIWRALDKNTSKLLEATLDPIRFFIKNMDSHYNTVSATWRRHYDTTL